MSPDLGLIQTADKEMTVLLWESFLTRCNRHANTSQLGVSGGFSFDCSTRVEVAVAVRIYEAFARTHSSIYYFGLQPKKRFFYPG